VNLSARSADAIKKMPSGNAKTGEDGKSGLAVKAIRTALIARWHGREKGIEGKK
jgi:hypothetical protein